MSLEVRVVVPAPLEATWARWSDIESWPRWNPMCTSAEMDGPLAPGTELSLKLVHPRGRGRTFLTQPRIVAVEPPRLLAWEAVGTGLRVATESRLAEDAKGTLLMVTSETTGRMAFSFRLMGLSDRTLARLYGAMLTALARDLAVAA